jgi:hypothetical protein
MTLNGLTFGLDFDMSMGIMKLKEIFKKKLGMGKDVKNVEPKSSLLFDFCHLELDLLSARVRATTLSAGVRDDNDGILPPSHSDFGDAIKWGKLKLSNNGVFYIRKELSTRNIGYDNGDGIMRLKKLLKQGASGGLQG